jgi:hypothetical protein
MASAEPIPPVPRMCHDAAKTADPDLAAVVEAWPSLPDAVRAGIIAMVRSYAASGRERAKPKQG